MKLQCLGIFLLFNTFVLAQKTHQVTLNPEEINLSNRAFYISAVIDARANKNLIGFAQKGLGNRRVEAKFKEPFTPYLQKTFSIMVPEEAALTPILAKVHNLYISETTTAFKEVGQAELSIEFLSEDKSKSMGMYHSTIKRNGADVTKKHGERVLSAIESCLIDLAKHWEERSETGVPLTTVYAYDPSVPLKKGIYASFSDFAKHEPSSIEDIELQKMPKHAETYKIADKGLRKMYKDSYGLYDGKDFYLNAAQYSSVSYYVKAQFSGQYIYFEDKLSDTGASIAFGLIGALASNKRIGFVLDTQTGIISELNRDYLAVILKDYPDLKKMYNKSKKDLAAKRAVLEKFNGVLAEQG